MIQTVMFCAFILFIAIPVGLYLVARFTDEDGSDVYGR